MIFHIPGIPHTSTNADFTHCAFTQKVFKLCKMLYDLGHTVYHYGSSTSNLTCSEHVTVIEDDFRKQFYSDNQENQNWCYDITDKCYKTFYLNCFKEINKRISENNFLLCSWGYGHKVIADQFEDKMTIVESGIGYKDTFAKFRVFESYSWMSYVYGLNKQNDGNYFDSVIPNAVDLEDFEFNDKKEEYCLYLGRIIHSKGIQIAIDTCTKLNRKLVISGQGKFNYNDFNVQNKEIIEFVGFADKNKRKELLADAKCLFVPTIYIEPFGGVAIEAMASGTPVICTDWGAFTETVIHGLTGFRCRTLEQFVWALENINNISSRSCYEWIKNNFSISRISDLYEEYFQMLFTLWGQGWYTEKHRFNLNWLDKKYPCHISASSPSPVFKVLF